MGLTLQGWGPQGSQRADPSPSPGLSFPRGPMQGCPGSSPEPSHPNEDQGGPGRETQRNRPSSRCLAPTAHREPGRPVPADQVRRVAGEPQAQHAFRDLAPQDLRAWCPEAWSKSSPKVLLGASPFSEHPMGPLTTGQYNIHPSQEAKALRPPESSEATFRSCVPPPTLKLLSRGDICNHNCVFIELNS